MTDERFWTDEKVEALKRCIAENLSASATGVLLGCSRNAVIGKAGRLGIALTSQRAGNRQVFATEEQAKAAGVEIPPGAPVGVPEEPRVARPKHERLFKPLPTPFEGLTDASAWWEVEDGQPGVGIADLNPSHCRAIVGAAPTRYCGEPIVHERFSFCKDHFAEYFVTPPRLKARRLERI